MKFFDKIKSFFKKKPAEKHEEAHPPKAQVEIKPETIEHKKETTDDGMRKNPERPQKTCPKCGAPNDAFVGKCWLCKSEI